MTTSSTPTPFSDEARAACPLLDAAFAKTYCAEAHALAAAREGDIPPQMRSLPELLARRARVAPDQPLITCGDDSLTAAEVHDLAARWGGTFAAEGIGKGDHVAMICGNRLEFLPLLAGIGWVGAVAVPINTASRGLQLQHILANSGAKAMIIEPQFLDALDTLDFSVLPLDRILVLGAAAGDNLPHGARPLPAPAEPVGSAPVKPSDPLAVLYTSGTTGLSKGVICPHEQFFWWAITTARQLGIRKGDVLHTTLPLFHTNALNTFFQALVFDGTLSLAERFSVSRYFDMLKESKADVTYLLGAMVPMLLSRPETPAERDHGCRVALAPGVPAQFHDAFTRRTGILLLDAFGSTESNNVIQTEADSVRPGYMGRVAEGFEARVVDDEDYELPDGTAGELVLRPVEPYAFALGYLGMAEATVSTWRNLWLHTGDRVVREADGYFRFVDRIKETIRRRGENISSFEVEQGVLSHPAVSTVAAFPVKSELAEDEVMVAIVLKEGATLTHEAVIRHCETRMPYFAVPRYVDFRADLPRTENGKIQKFKLREQGITDSTWDREAAGVTVKR